jgi:hypothetical protein
VRVCFGPKRSQDNSVFLASPIQLLWEVGKFRIIVIHSFGEGPAFMRGKD